jgi:hypothetical protein
LNKELETYFENQFDMTSGAGWKDFTEKVKEMVAKDSQIFTIKDEEELFKRQGRLDILSWILGWRDACEVTYKDLQDEQDL